MAWWSPRWSRVAGVVALLVPASSRAVTAQSEWNSSAAIALAERARDRRLVDRPDSGLTSYQARARGFVLFLARLGDSLGTPPRLVKADQLAVEVYWRSPGQSKQIIQAWRDGRWLPTDIRYHRDHLGIVTNDFGPLIRIGEGDEVRDLPHPLSAAGRTLYDFALGDAVTIRTGASQVTVRALEVRPRSMDQAGVIGTLYIDTTSAAVVRFRFGFTPASYLDHQLSDITVLLDNALIEQRWWLPVRQVIEIRRRVAWLDFPAQSIIRGRWEIGDYRFNQPLPEELFRGPAIAGMVSPNDSSGVWSGSLADAVDSMAPPIGPDDLSALRAQVGQVAGGKALERLRPLRLGVPGVSDLIHVNRVQGLALGGGLSLGNGAWRVKPRVGYGFDDRQATGAVVVERHSGRGVSGFEVGRSLIDFSDLPAASRLVNSITAQGWGDDAGDYVRLDRVALHHRERVGGRAVIGTEMALERSRSVSTNAKPSSGSYRPNPALGGGTYELVRLSLERSIAADLQRDWGASIDLESGAGPAGYSRVRMTLSGQIPAGPGAVAASLFTGAGTARLPAWRSFALGGRMTLPGEDFRVFGGRTALLGRVEWRLQLPAPGIPLGRFVSTGNRFTLAPFVAVGWTDGRVDGVSWRPSPGLRPVAGISAEFFLHLVRVEAGIGLRTGRVGVSLDVAPAWWPVL